MASHRFQHDKETKATKAAQLTSTNSTKAVTEHSVTLCHVHRVRTHCMILACVRASVLAHDMYASGTDKTRDYALVSRMCLEPKVLPARGVEARV